MADRWFRAWLKDDESALEGWPRVELFVMGANRWRAEDDWPLARARYTSFYLRGGGAANTSAGDGTLSCEAPGDEPPDRYVYDPRDPVMTLYTPPGQNEPQDQRRLDGRDDVLVYATPPLEREIEVTGPVSLRLWAASSAPDTDFTAKLIDVWPNGFAQELCYGIVRARYRDSFDAPSLDRAGPALRVHADAQPHEQPVQAGPPDQGGCLQQRLPELRPQPQHGRRRLRQREARRGKPDRLPQPDKAVEDHPARHRAVAVQSW